VALGQRKFVPDGMLSLIIPHSFGGKTFLWFQCILIISIPFPLDPVLDNAIPLSQLVLYDAFQSPFVTLRVKLHRSWLSVNVGQVSRGIL